MQITYQQHFLSFFLTSLFSSSFILVSLTALVLASPLVILFLSQIYLIRYPKASLMFSPLSALTAKNWQLYSVFNSSILSLYRYSCSANLTGVKRSHLFPSSNFGISLPQCRTNCCSQVLASLRDSSLVRSKTTHAAFDSVKQLQTMVRQRSWPAESQSQRLKVVSLCCTFLKRQSMPIVGF